MVCTFVDGAHQARFAPGAEHARLPRRGEDGLQMTLTDQFQRRKPQLRAAIGLRASYRPMCPVALSPTLSHKGRINPLEDIIHAAIKK